jgi:hypothetical protein
VIVGLTFQKILYNYIVAQWLGSVSLVKEAMHVKRFFTKAKSLLAKIPFITLLDWTSRVNEVVELIEWLTRLLG